MGQIRAGRMPFVSLAPIDHADTLHYTCAVGHQILRCAGCATQMTPATEWSSAPSPALMRCSLVATPARSCATKIVAYACALCPASTYPAAM